MFFCSTGSIDILWYLVWVYCFLEVSFFQKYENSFCLLSCCLTEWESRCETRKLSSKGEIYELEASQWEIIEQLTSHKYKCKSFQDNWECRDQFESQLGNKEGLFRRLVIYEEMPDFSQTTSLMLHQRFHSTEKCYECEACRK